MRVSTIQKNQIWNEIKLTDRKLIFIQFNGQAVKVCFSSFLSGLFALRVPFRFSIRIFPCPFPVFTSRRKKRKRSWKSHLIMGSRFGHHIKISALTYRSVSGTRCEFPKRKLNLLKLLSRSLNFNHVHFGDLMWTIGLYALINLSGSRCYAFFSLPSRDLSLSPVRLALAK